MRRFYAPLFSSAYMFRTITAMSAIIVPFIISYTIQPFWLTQSSYLDQPRVNFKHQMILMLEGTKPGSDIVWSTYDQLNLMMGQKFRVAQIQARAEDANLDGKMDELHLSAKVPLKTGEIIHHVRAIMFFDYQLSGKVNLQMESAAYLDHVSMVSGGELELWGSLQLRQRSLLPQSSAVRTTYNTSVIVPSNGGIDSMSQVQFGTMLDNYLSRNESTILGDVYPVWTAAADSYFTLKAHIQIPPEQIIQYQPGVLETLRHGVIQFLAVYVFVAALLGAANHFIFENQVFETRVRDDSKLKGHIH